MFRSAGGGNFSVFLSLQETIVSWEAVPEVLDMKYRSECKHGFTNCGCLHCAVLKALIVFMEKKSP